MRDSDTYLAILDEGRDEGRDEEAKSVILRMGHRRFGAPAESISTQLRAIADLERLHRIEERMLDATSWQDLLDTP